MNIKNRVLNKLSSNSGTSLMVALLFFVMCATVGSIILASATASDGRLRNLKENNQTYFTTASAADIFCHMVEENAITIHLTETTTTYEPSSTILTELVKKRVSPERQFPLFGFEDPYVLTRPNQKVGFEEETNPVVVSFSVNDSTIENIDVLSSNVSMSLDKEMNLVAIIRPADATKEDYNNLRITMKPLVNVSEAITDSDNNRSVNDDERVTEREKIVTITWGDPVIEKGA